MTVSVVTADDILALAKSIKSLSEAQMTRISDLVAFMEDEDLKMLHGMLEKAKAKEVELMKEELEMHKKVAAKYQEYKADKARGQLKAAETPSQKKDEAAANQLIKNI